MGKKSAPAAPDYTSLAQQQAKDQQNLLTQQTWANRADQTNPWGSETWSSQVVTDPATGQQVTKWSQNTTLDPQLQSALDSQMNIQAGLGKTAEGMLGRVQSQYGQPIDTSGLTGWGSTPQAGNLQAITNPYGFSPQQQNIDTSRLQGGNYYNQQAGDALYGQATSRLDPQWQAQQKQLETQLANKGITSGSTAYQQAMDQFQRQKTDAYNQAQYQSAIGAGQEAQRTQGMDLGARQAQLGAQEQAWNQSLGFGQYGLGQQQQAFGQQQQAGAQNFQQQLQQSQYQDQQRQQQLAEMLGLRSQDYNELMSLLQGSQVQQPQFGNYSQAGQGQAADLTGAAQQSYNAQVQAQNAANAQRSSTFATIGTVAAAF